MTTAAEPTPAENNPGRTSAASTDGMTSDRTELRVSDPAECIAAVPALLGFVPRRSLVACLLAPSPHQPGAAILGAVARHDLDTPGHGEWEAVAAYLAGLCVRENTVAVLVLIIDDRAGAPHAGRAGARSGRYRDLVTTIECALVRDRIALDEAWVVRAIADGEPWWDAFEPAIVGVQTDPAASPIALAHALEGHPIRHSRAELCALVAEDAQLRSAVATELEPAGVLAGHRFRAAVFRDEMDCYHRAALGQVLAQIDALAVGGGVDARALAETAVAVRDPTVRDALFALTGGHRAEPAEWLWAQLCRALAGADRAEAATLFGYSAYARGDGALAGIALQAALEADPDHTVARLLDTALGTGMRPQEIRKLACSGRSKAAELGIELDLCPDWLRS